MEDFFTRLLKEEKELNEKLKKLSLFIGTEKYFKLDFYDQELLIEQKIYMTGYSATLRERIKSIEAKMCNELQK